MPANLETIYNILTNQITQDSAKIPEEFLQARLEADRITKLTILIGETQRDVVAKEDAAYVNRRPKGITKHRMFFLNSFLTDCDNNTLRERLFSTNPHLKAGKELSPQQINEEDEEFTAINQRLKYFPNSLDSAEFARYKQFYLLCRHRALVIEDCQMEYPPETAARAYKMAVLFNSIKDADKFINANNSNLAKPVHDLMNIATLPACANYGVCGYDLEAWKKIINAPPQDKHSDIKPLDALRFISLARGLNDKMVELGADHFTPQSAAELMAVKRQVVYKRFAENPQLAAILEHYSVGGDIFEKCLGLYERGKIKTDATDTMPNVVVDLGKINPAHDGFYFIKLKKGDPRGLILGNIVTSCQRIGAQAEQCAIDGTNRDDTCFYILVQAKNKSEKLNYDELDWSLDFERKYNIIGESYFWKSAMDFGAQTVGNLVADSFESSLLARTLPIKEMFQEFARQSFLQQETISRVMIGEGGATKATNLKDLPQSYIETFEGYSYDADSFRQLVVDVSDDMKRFVAEISSILQERFGARIPNFKFYSHYEADFFLHNLQQFPSLELVKIKALSSAGAMKFWYKKYCKDDFTPSKLAEFDAKKIYALTSEDALKCYEDEFIPFEKLIDHDAAFIEAITSPEVSAACDDRFGITLSDLMDLDGKMVNALTNDCAREFYQKNIFSFKELMEKKASAISSYNTMFYLNNAQITRKELMELDADKIDALLSCEASFTFRGCLELRQLIDLDAQKIEALTRDGFLNNILASRGMPFVNYLIKELKTRELDDIKKLTSKCAVDNYIKGYDVKDLDKLTSSQIENGYLQTEPVPPKAEPASPSTTTLAGSVIDTGRPV